MLLHHCSGSHAPVEFLANIHRFGPLFLARYNKKT
jgi:hypothetical protein